MKVKEFADVIKGLAITANVKNTEDVQKNFYIVKTSSLSADGEITTAGLDLGYKFGATPNNLNTFLGYAFKPLKNALRKNDVLITAKGTRFRAAFVTTPILEDNLPLIPCSNLIILRMRDEIILPEYVAIYLNSRAGLDMIHNICGCGKKLNITLSTAGELDIPVPPIADQQSIISEYNRLLALKHEVNKQQAAINQKLLFKKS